jgi:hypothetical protein
MLERAVAESDARHAEKTAELIAAVESKMERRRQADLLAMEENVKFIEKRWNVFYRASADFRGSQ